MKNRDALVSANDRFQKATNAAMEVFLKEVAAHWEPELERCSMVAFLRDGSADKQMLYTAEITLRRRELTCEELLIPGMQGLSYPDYKRIDDLPEPTE